MARKKLCFSSTYFQMKCIWFWWYQQGKKWKIVMWVVFGEILSLKEKFYENCRDFVIMFTFSDGYQTFLTFFHNFFGFLRFYESGEFLGLKSVDFFQKKNKLFLLQKIMVFFGSTNRFKSEFELEGSNSKTVCEIACIKCVKSLNSLFNPFHFFFSFFSFFFFHYFISLTEHFPAPAILIYWKYLFFFKFIWINQNRMKF